jgi:ligand-binding sensor domain-containing protein/signal transduction histidine kinase
MAEAKKEKMTGSIIKCILLDVLITLLVTITISVTVKAQYNFSQLQFKSISIENGLTNNKVNAVSKDKQGFIWFATNDGLCRYDGIHIRAYYPTPRNMANINANHINTLYTDTRGNLWIGTYSLFMYNYQGDSIVHFSSNENEHKLGRVRVILNDNKGRLWLGTTKGLFLYDIDKNSLRHYPYGKTENYEVLAMAADDNSLWLGTKEYSLLTFDLLTEKFKPFNLPPEMHDQKNEIYCLFRDDKDDLWAGTSANGIFRFNLKNSSFRHIYPDKDIELSYRVRKIIKDRKGNIWIGTRAGLYLMNQENEEIYRYAYHQHLTSRLTDNSIFDIYIDNHQIMWLGTFAGGVNYTNLNGKPFNNFYKIDNMPGSLSDNLLYGFAEDKDGNLYIGTNEGGLNYFKKKQGNFSIYMMQPGNRCSIKSNNIKNIEIEKSGNLWIATYKGGVNYFDVKAKCFKELAEVTHPGNKLLSDNTYDLVIDDEENLWIASDKGIDVLRKQTKRTEKVMLMNKVLCLYKDKNGEIWAGVEDTGLFRYEKAKNRFLPVYREMINYTVRTILIDSENNIWTGGINGLTFLRPSDSTFVIYNKIRKFPANLIMGILEDGNKNLWVSTTAGLIKCVGAVSNPLNFTTHNYTLQDGLQNNHFLSYSYYKCRSGEMLFGGISGFTMFHPDSIKDDPYPPEIALTEIRIFSNPVKIGQKVSGKIILKKALNQCSELILSYKHRVFTIEFTALHYANPSCNRYKYIMYPFEKEWNYTNASRSFATYTNLPGGIYSFKVFAANSDGLWTENPRELKIIVKPPVWKTVWFIILISAVAFLLLVMLYLRRIKAVELQKKLLEKKVEKRTRTIKEINDLLSKNAEELRAKNKLLEEQKRQISGQAKELEQKQAELIEQKEMLQNLNVMKDKLFSIIAHDLKSPFQGILGLTDMMSKTYDEMGDAERKSYLEIIHNASENFYNLLENLLHWSRTQLNHVSFNPVNTDIKNIINKNRILFEEQYSHKNIHVEEIYSSDTIVFADINMTETVVRNLISNAVKFTPEGGSITIKVEDYGNMKLISVEDTGIGMTREILDSLFKIDRPVSRQGTSGEPGTGLGLLICHEFVRKNSGEIWVESTPGKGSTFFFTLPAGGV